MYRKLFLILIFLIILLLPVTSYAADFRNKGNTTIPAGQTINQNLYITGGNATVDGTVNGDLFIMGGQSRVTGTVNGDLFIMGGQASISGNVTGDLRAAGGNVSLDGRVGGEMLAAGGNVDVGSRATISKGVYVAGGQFVFSGTAASINAAVTKLTLTSTARVNGNVNYTSSNKAQIDNGAVISGKITQKSPPQGKNARRGAVAAFTATRILSAITTIILALLFFLLLPFKSAKLTILWRRNFGFSILWGILFLILAPIIAFILVITIIGIPVAIGIMLLYPILIYLGRLVGIIALGTLVQGWLERKKDFLPTWVSVLIGAIIYILLGLIPVVGWLINLVIFLAGLGALISYDWGLLGHLRKEQNI